MKKILFCILSFIIFSIEISAQDVVSGIKLIKYEKYTAAKQNFRSLLNGKSKAEAYFHLGEIYMVENKVDSAKLCYTAGITADRDFPLNYAGLVRVNLAIKNKSEADKYHAQAMELGDDDPDVFVVLAEAYASNYGGKNYEQSIGLLNNGIKINPKYPRTYITLGTVQLDKGNGTEAIKNFQKAIELDKSNPEPYTRISKVHVLIKNYNDALSFLNTAIEVDPNYPQAYNQMAELYADMKDYPKAAQYYAQYIEASEITTEKQKRFASILYLNKEYDKSINILNDVISKEPDNAASIRVLAYSYLRKDDIQNSKKYFQELFEMPDVEYLSTDYENYADLLSKTGNDSLAIVYLYKIIELDSSKTQVYGDISILYFKNKNWDGVISALAKKGELKAQEYFDLGKAFYFRAEKKVGVLGQKLTDQLSITSDQRHNIRIAVIEYQKNNADGKSNALSMLNEKMDSILTSSQRTQWASISDQWLSEFNNSGVYEDYISADSSFGLLALRVPDLAVAPFWRARVNANFDPESVFGLAKPFYEQFITLSKEDTVKFKKELIEAYSYLGYFYFLMEDNSNSKLYWQKVYAIDPTNNQAVEALKNL